MKTNRTYLLVVATLLLVFLGVSPAFAQPNLAPIGTSFTYQGELLYQGALANGSFDFQFSLHDASGGGAQVGGTITKSGVTVTEGRFTVSLDFGSGIFIGDARWLEIAVRTAGGSGYTTLTPRQELTPAPYAIHASSVDGLPDIQSTQVSMQSTQVAIHATQSALNTRVGKGVIAGYKLGDCIGVATDVTPITCTVSMGQVTSTVIAEPVGASSGSYVIGFIDLYFPGDSTIDYVMYGDGDTSVTVAVGWIAVPLSP